MKQYYALLELESDATDKDIQKAYRRLAKTMHPDINKEPDANEKFMLIKEAFEVLGDSDSKKEYDDFVKQMAESQPTQTFQGLYNSIFPEKKQSNLIKVHGDDLEIHVDFTIQDVLTGAEKTIEFDRFVNCKECNGIGFDSVNTPHCPDCSGSGYIFHEVDSVFGNIKAEQLCSCCKGKGYIDIKNCSGCKGKGKNTVKVELTFNTPSEVIDGYRYVLKKKGDEGINGGKQGSLILIFKHSKTDIFKISDKYDLTMTVKVPYLTSLTGGTVPVQMPTGEMVKVPVPRRAQDGHLVVMPNEGLVNPQNGFVGNLTITLSIENPIITSESKLQAIIELLK